MIIFDQIKEKVEQDQGSDETFMDQLLSTMQGDLSVENILNDQEIPDFLMKSPDFKKGCNSAIVFES